MSVVFLGFLSGFHGHFITEELARLWWVLQNGIKSHKFAFVRYKRASLGAFERLKRFSNESFSYRCKRTIRQ